MCVLMTRKGLCLSQVIWIRWNTNKLYRQTQHNTPGSKYAVLHACCIGLRMRRGTFYSPGQGKKERACCIDNSVIGMRKEICLVSSVLQGVW